MREKKVVFISGPITGVHDYKGTFDDAAVLVERAGFIPLNPAVLPQGMDRSDYMPITLAMIDAADMLLMLHGWEKSDGATLENGYAEYRKKPCLDWIHFRDRYLSSQKPEPEPEQKPVQKQSRVTRMFGPKESWSGSGTQTPEQKPFDYTNGHKGFLLIRCPECGEIRGFCSKQPIAETLCRNCETEIPLGDLLPAYVKCGKCGSQFKYRTNIRDPEPFTFECLNCEAPIDLQLNSRETAIVTVGDKEARRTAR